MNTRIRCKQEDDRDFHGAVAPSDNLSLDRQVHALAYQAIID